MAWILATKTKVTCLSETVFFHLHIPELLPLARVHYSPLIISYKLTLICILGAQKKQLLQLFVLVSFGRDKNGSMTE